MAVRKLNGQWVVEFELRGHRVFRRLPAGATKGQALELETRRRSELIDQSVLGHAPTVPLAWAIGQWRAAATTKDNSLKSKTKLVLEAIGADLMLTRDGVVEAAKRIRAMKRKKGEGPYQASTVNRRLSVIKATCKWAWKIQHWTPDNLSPYVVMLDKKLEHVRDRTITQAQVEKLIRAAPNFDTKAYIALGAYGLMRTGEIMRAKPADVGRGLTLPKTKNGVPRVVPILPALRPFLAALPLKYHHRTLYRWFEGTRDQIPGLAGIVHHDLRRSGATTLLNAGVPLEVVAHILGDSLDVARKVYARVLNRTAAKAMRKGFRPIKNPSAKSRLGVNS